MKKNLKLFILLGSLFGVGVSTLAPTHVQSVSATDSIKSAIDTTTPYEDLINDETFKLKYNSNQYGFGKGDKCELLSFIEYAYDSTYSWDYGLYLYIYNPIYDNVDYTSSKNCVTMQLSDSNKNIVSPFKKYNLEYISRSSINNHYVFLKYKLKLDSDTYSLLSSSKRIYDISEFELKSFTNDNATAFNVGKSYSYTGYARGIKDSINTLKCETFETLEIELHGGYKRSGYINSALTQAKDLHYAYFSVPNEYINKYGSLYSVKYTGYKVEYTQPFYVWDTSQTDIVNGTSTAHCFKFYDPKNFGNTAETQFVLAEPYIRSGYWDSNCEHVHNDEYDSDWQISSAFTNTLPTERLFYTNDLDVDIDKNFVYQRIQENLDKFTFIKTDISNELCVDDIQSSTGLAPSPNSSFLTGFFNFFMRGETGLGRDNSDGTGVYWGDLDALVEVKNKESNNKGNSYFINENDVTEFNNYLTESNRNNKSMYLFRFDTSDYWSAPIAEQQSSWVLWENHAQIRGYSSYITAIEDFDIITLTFRAENEFMTIPVVASPINIYPDLSRPPLTSGENHNWLYIILGIVGGCLIIIALSKIYTFVTDAKSKNMSYKMNKLSFKEKKSKLKNKKRKD